MSTYLDLKTYLTDTGSKAYLKTSGVNIRCMAEYPDFENE